MPRVILVVRELNKSKPDFSMTFDVPEVPAVGSYISVFRAGNPGRSEDVIVRHVWWHLNHAAALQGTQSSGTGPIGTVTDIMLECDVAVGPYATKEWIAWAHAASARGATVVNFDVERFVFGP